MFKIVSVVAGLAVVGMFLTDVGRQLVEDLLPTPELIKTRCTGAARPPGNMKTAESPQLRKLAEYEEVCGGAIADRFMLFAPTPTTVEESRVYAADLATSLKEFAIYSVQPLVVLEPATLHGDILDLQKYRAGDYDTALSNYFQALKAEGLTDKTMGMWVIMPEANTPAWRTTRPDDFVAITAKTVTLQKQYFPTSKASILLNSLSYPDHDEHWQHGTFASLVPYVENLPKGLIDSFGYQGFPWSPPADSHNAPSLMNPQVFLRDDLAREAAQKLGVEEVWFNTGTFRQSYSGQTGKTVTIPPEKRTEILEGVLAQAKKMQNAQFKVAVHLFAEDKSQVSERVDWSYWQTGKAADSPSTAAFKQFAHGAQDAKIGIWLYDSMHDDQQSAE